MTRIIESLAEISNNYDALFCDLWGCVHDGVKGLPDAIEALRAFRANGGKVVLLTNSPRPRKGVEKQAALKTHVTLFAGALGQGFALCLRGLPSQL